MLGQIMMAPERDTPEPEFLHRSKGLWVLNKPADLPTSGRTLQDPDCLQHRLIQFHGSMVWAVHQLDADTSGLNLFVTAKHLVGIHKERLSWPQAEQRYLASLPSVGRVDPIVDEGAAPVPGPHRMVARVGTAQRATISPSVGRTRTMC